MESPFKKFQGYAAKFIVKDLIADQSIVGDDILKELQRRVLDQMDWKIWRECRSCRQCGRIHPTFEGQEFCWRMASMPFGRREGILR